MVYADIELINGGDLEMVQRGYMDKDEIRKLPINVLVDTGSFPLAINENIQEVLKITVVGKKKLTLANGESVLYDIVCPVEVRFKNRICTCRAVVLPGSSEPLLGAIPLEEMDLIVHPKKQELITNPAHGEDGLWMLKSYRESVLIKK